MARNFLKMSLLLVAVAIAQAFAAEPLLGIWKLTSQTVDGHKVESEDLTLRVYPAGDGFEFAYSTPVNGIHLVSLKFASVHLNGAPAIVEDGRGNKLGTVTITKTGASQYKAIIEGPNRPKALGRMTVSGDGKTLTSESMAADEKGPKAIQLFSRQ